MLEHHLERLLDLEKPSPLLLTVSWTIARKLISQLARSSLSRIKHVLFFFSFFYVFFVSGDNTAPQLVC